MYLGLSLAAALCYTAGGVFMKLSEGLTRPLPAALVFACFLVGAGLQALAMRQADLGVAYVFVLGLEAGLAFLLGILIFGESPSTVKTLGLLLIVLGMVLPHSDGPSEERKAEPVEPDR